MAKQSNTQSCRRFGSRPTVFLGCTAMSFALSVAPALGQATSPQGAEADEDSNVIIVTAQRRAQALEDVPMTVAVVSPETLQAAGINTVRDLQNVTSGFQVNQGGSYPQPSIRGVTTINAGAYENNVALFVDGLYQTTPQVLNMDLPNVESIQILKGPQGTLYGRNATGGAILIDTIDPSDTWEGMAEVGYGRFDDKRLRAYIAGPLDERTGFSVSGSYRQTDGYFKRASRTNPGEFDGRFLGLKQGSIRTKLKIALTDDFTATIGYNYLRADDPRGVVFTPIENVSTPYTSQANGAFSGRETRPRGLGEVAGDVFEIDLRQHEGFLRLELDTGIGTLRSVTGYTKAKLDTFFDFGGTYSPDTYSESRIHDTTTQQAIDLTINAIENLDLIVGGTYYNIKTRYPDDGPSAFFFGPASLGQPHDARVMTPLSSYRLLNETFFFRTKEAWAGFIDATFQATDRISVNLGGRYSKETQDVSGYKINYSTATGAPVSCPYSRDGETRAGLVCTNGASRKKATFKKFTPRASVRYELTPGTNVYASYSKGFRSGEFNSVLPSDNPALYFPVEQESVDAYEVGFKHAGRRLRFEASAFYYDYKDLQTSVTQVNPLTGQPLVTLQNAPGAKIKGVEANADYEVFDNFNVRAGATYLHARYKKGFFFSGTGVNPAGAGFNTNDDPLKVFPNIGLEMDLSGKQLSRAPDFSGYLGFDYLIPNGDGGIRIAANAKYTDSYVVTNPSIWGGEPAAALIARRNAAGNQNLAPNNNALFAGTPFADRANEQRARQGSFVLLNASVQWTDPLDHYYVRVWGNNLLDKKYRVHYNPLAGGTYAPIGEPLTFGVTAGYKFGDAR
jgi:iron complex outermembrane recepter protein